MRFSLRGLIVVVVILGLAVTAGFLAYDNSKLRQELLDHGVLYVEDYGKINVAPYDLGEEDWWRWKIYLPDDAKNPIVCMHAGPLKRGEEPTRTAWMPVKSGMQVMDVKVRRNANGEWQLMSKMGLTSIADSIPWLTKDSEGLAVRTQTFGKKGVAPGRKFEVLRITETKNNVDGSFNTLSVWIELNGKD